MISAQLQTLAKVLNIRDPAKILCNKEGGESGGMVALVVLVKLVGLS